MAEPEHLIIIGTGKAGTTSLFYYLSAHPQICPATTKEPGFFFDPDYPAVTVCSFDDGVETYEKLFPTWKPGQTRMEATPEYIYSPGTAARIKATFPNARILVSLREPVSLFKSMFQYAQQRGKIPNETTLDEHIDDQFRLLESGHETAGTLHLTMGLFSAHLKPYLEHFPPDQLKVIFLEDLKRDCFASIQDVCSFCGLDPQFYEHYTFKVHNRTAHIKHQRMSRRLNTLRGILNGVTYDKPRLHACIRWVHASLFEPVWLQINRLGRKDEVSVSESAVARLREYYAAEKESLERLLNQPPPGSQKYHRG